MTLDIETLRALALKATAGPWSADLDMFDSNEGIVCLVSDPTCELMAILGTDLVIESAEPWTAEAEAAKNAQWRKARETQQLRDAAYIAAANPQAVLALLDRIAALEAGLREACEAIDDLDHRRADQRHEGAPDPRRRGCWVWPGCGDGGTREDRGPARM